MISRRTFLLGVFGMLSLHLPQILWSSRYFLIFPDVGDFPKNVKEGFRNSAASNSQSEQQPHPQTQTRTQKQSQFSWNNIAYEIRPSCGNEKCFYRSVKDPNQTGFLISGAARMRGLERAWSISQNIDELLHNRHQGGPARRHHFYSHPPLKVGVLSDNLKNLKQSKHEVPFSHSSALVIQEVDVAPYPSELAVLGCSDRRITEGWQDAVAMILGFNETTRVFENRDPHAVGEAISTFGESIDDTLEVVRVHPNLVFDFQVFLNARGQIFHFDLDRGIRPASDSDIAVCVCNLRKLAALFSNYRDYLVLEKDSTESIAYFPLQNLMQSLLMDTSTFEERESLLVGNSTIFQHLKGCQ